MCDNQIKRKDDYTFSNTHTAVAFRARFAQLIDVLLDFREKPMYQGRDNYAFYGRYVHPKTFVLRSLSLVQISR